MSTSPRNVPANQTTLRHSLNVRIWRCLADNRRSALSYYLASASAPWACPSVPLGGFEAMLTSDRCAHRMVTEDPLHVSVVKRCAMMRDPMRNHCLFPTRVR